MNKEFLKLKNIKGSILPLVMIVGLVLGLVAVVALTKGVSFRNSGATNGYAVIVSYPLDPNHDGAEPVCVETSTVKVTVQIVMPEGVTAWLQREYYIAGNAGDPDRFYKSELVKNGDIKTYTYPWYGGASGSETHAGFNLIDTTTGNALLDHGAGFDFFVPTGCPTPTPTPIVVGTPTATPTPTASPVPTPTPAGVCNYVEINIQGKPAQTPKATVNPTAR